MGVEPSGWDLCPYKYPLLVEESTAHTLDTCLWFLDLAVSIP